MQNATPEQIEKAFKLCDMLCLEDVTLAATILQQMDWSVQKALQSMMDTAKQGHPKKQQPQLPTNYKQNEEEQQEEDPYNQYQYGVFEREQNTENNRRMFDEAYQQIKLDRTQTEPPKKLQKRLSYDRKIIKDFANHRHSYQAQLLEDAEKFYKRILQGNKYHLKKADQNIAKNERNRQFICYLDKNFRCGINFTFGTFMLNLVRSYLDKKYLLVYIHKLECEDSRSVRMILAHKETTKFINKNFVSYGMFDNCDDYDIIQKYIPLKDVPAFAIFKYNPKNQKQKFIASYQILQKQPTNFMEWLAGNSGISIIKKESEQQQKSKQQLLKKKQQQQKEKKKTEYKFKHSDIMDQQNREYEEMQRIYKLRRQQSKLKKEQIQNAELAIKKMKQKFAIQPKFEDGKTIQIKFRLPYSGKSIQRVFINSHLIKEMFEYINCFGRDQFQQRFANFDLTQTFPKLSLLDKQNKKINQIFQFSANENIIVKQI